MVTPARHVFSASRHCVGSERIGRFVEPGNGFPWVHVAERDCPRAFQPRRYICVVPQVVDRKRAWKNIEEIASRVCDLQPDPNEDPTAAEERIAEEVKDFRHKHA